MAKNPLEKWERPHAGKAAPSAEPQPEADTVVELADYKADKGKDRTHGWLKIKPAAGAAALMSYAQLLKVTFDEPLFTEIVLVFSFETVIVRGRDMQTHVTGLQTRSLGSITEFNPATQALPAEGEPFVTSIEFVPGSPRDRQGIRTG